MYIRNEQFDFSFYVTEIIVELKEDEYTIAETESNVSIGVVRTGDLSKTSSVTLFTEENDAKDGVDFVERPDKPVSNVVFQPGKGPCVSIRHVNIFTNSSFHMYVTVKIYSALSVLCMILTSKIH